MLPDLNLWLNYIPNHSLSNDISQFFTHLYIISFLLFYLISHLFCHTTEYSIKSSFAFFSVLFKPTLKPTFYCRIIYLFAKLCKIYLRKKTAAFNHGLIFCPNVNHLEELFNLFFFIFSTIWVPVAIFHSLYSLYLSHFRKFCSYSHSIVAGGLLVIS